ncbi:glycogen debranching N-terminal domain-containing protein [Intrasporangium mesophilum]
MHQDTAGTSRDVSPETGPETEPGSVHDSGHEREPRAYQPWLHDLAICVDGNGTVLSDADGSIRADGAQGFFVDDERVLSVLVVALGEGDLLHVAGASRGSRSEFLASARHLGDTGPDPTVEVHRVRRVSGNELTERVVVVSRASGPVHADLTVTLAADGADIGRVKAGVAAPPPVDLTLVGRSSASWRTSRLAGHAAFTTVPDRVELTPGRLVATYSLDLRPGQPAEVGLTVTAHRTEPSEFPAEAGSRTVHWDDAVRVDAGDPRLGKVVATSLADLRSLLLTDPSNPDDIFVGAGTPWYLTLFGRDSIWAARMALPLGTELAGGTLRALARRQGVRVDVDTAEAPGKIPHELRRTAYVDDAVGFALPPVYYGTVDATALWISLLHDAWRWGLPEAEVRDLVPALRAAGRWLTELAAPDADGLVKYVDESGHGLVNQGWKDSGDSMRFRDGRVADAPIALVEAQAYAVEAARAAAVLLRAVGADDDAELADSLVAWGDSLAARIRDRFWVDVDGRRLLAMAIDGRGEPVDGVGSNMGHVLGTGVLEPVEAEQVAGVLTGPTMLGRYGIATLATDNGGFNPIGYHTGSVWVHDTAICALGLTREGRGDLAGQVVSRMVDLGEAVGYRLPELFADAGPLGLPAPYPASCRPQAWAAASAVAMLTVALGLSVDVPAGTVTLRPPASMPFGPLRVSGLRIAGAAVTVTVGLDGAVAVEGLPPGLTLLA